MQSADSPQPSFHLHLVSTRALKNLRFGVTTVLLSLTVLALAALLAGSIPLWRASRLDPTSALRWE